MENLIGQVIKGYEIRDQIGEGGFGAVYKAYQPVIGREVAVKIIQPEYANKPDFIRKFEAEAQIIARLEHFHIVPLYDYWREPDGAYFVMRYLRGGSLRDLLTGQPLPVDRVVRILDQISSALTIAHRNNVVHRDLKPDNILLDDDGNAYLADFGIAKLLENEVTSETVTNNTMIGSPAYASPEQIRATTVTGAADQYSLGMMLFEMLTGKHPFEGTNISGMLIKQLQEPLPSVHQYNPNLPEELDMVLARATEKNAINRYRNVQTMAAEVKEVLVSDSDMTTTLQTFDLPTGNTTSQRRETIELTMNWDEADNPYKGLRPFQEADAADFFGRERLIDRLLRHFERADRRFLALVGPSGSGKSSVVKAGLIPALREGRIVESESWFIVEMLPGAYPLEELEAALLRMATRSVDSLIDILRSGPDGLIKAVAAIMPDDDSELVLYIDQFEEMFTFVDDEAERAHILLILEEAVRRVDSRLRIIVTLRADFYDRPLLYPSFGDMFRQNTEVVLPMSDEELSECILGPANRVRMHIEPGLVQAIVNDVRDQPGALPLLQYALTELFERRDGPALTLKAYHQIGGAMGALARRADEIFTQLDLIGKESTKQLFLRLVTLGEGTEDTRRRVVKSELISLSGEDDAMENTINLFSRYRLLTLDRDAFTREPTVEIAHESLIREWSKLRDWLNASRDDLRMQRRIMIAADDWRKYGRDRSYLARGAQLETFEIWLDSTDLQLTELENDYLKQSIERREVENAQLAAQAEREQKLEERNRSVLRALVIVLIGALTVAMILTVWALGERTTAQNYALTADRSADVARSSSLAAQAKLALLNHDIDLAVTLALAANDIENPPAIAQSVLFDVAYHPGTSHLNAAEDDEISVAVMTDSQSVVYGTKAGLLALWNPETDELDILNEGDVSITALAVKPNSNEVIVGQQSGIVYRYDISDRQIISRFELTLGDGGHQVTALTYNQDFTEIFAGLQNGFIVRLSLLTGTSNIPLGTMDNQHNGGITALTLSDDGNTLLSASVDRSVHVWDVNTGTFTALIGHNAPVRDAVFSLDQQYIISGAQNGEIFRWDVRDLSQYTQLSANGMTLWQLASGQNNTLFSAGQDGIIHRWDLTNGNLIDSYLGHQGNVLDMRAVFGDNELLSTSTDGTVRLWNFSNRQLEYTREDTGSTRAGVFSLDISGDVLLSSGAFGSLKLWDSETGVIDVAADERIVTFNTSFTQSRFIKDGTQILTGSIDGSVNLWDIESGAQLVSFGRHRGNVNTLTVHPDENVFATASRDRTLRIWDIASGEELLRPMEREEAITSLAYAPDGAYLLAGRADGSIVVFDVNENYAVLKIIEGLHDREITSVAYNNSGTRFATGSLDQTARVFDSETFEPLQRMVGHEDGILAIAFAPNRQGLLTASGNTFADDVDASLRLWDIDTGQQLRRFGLEHIENINAIVFTESGDAVISGDGFSDIRRYAMLTLDELYGYVQENRYARPLSCGEQALYEIQQTDCS